MTTPAPADNTTTAFGAIRRHRNLVAGVFVLVAVSVLAYRSALKPPAVAVAKVVVEDPRNSASGIGDADPVGYFAGQLALARLPVIARRAVATQPRPNRLTADDVAVTADPAGDTIIFTTTLPQGQDAAARALDDAVVAGFVKQSQAARQQEARTSLSAVDASLVALQNSTYSLLPDSIALREQLKSRQTALTQEAAASVSVLAISPAETQPSGAPGVSRLGLVLVLGGSLLAVGVVLGADGPARRLTTAEEAAAVSGLPVLAHLSLAPSGRAAADAVWSALAPPAGGVFVLAASNALDPARGRLGRLRTWRASSREIPGAALAAVTVLHPPVQAVHYVGERLEASPVLVLASPRTRAAGLREALAELGRARMMPTGIVWASAPATSLLRGRRRPASSLQRPVPPVLS